MKCKYCGSELMDDNKTCPMCGSESIYPEDPAQADGEDVMIVPLKKNAPKTLIAIIVTAVAVLLVVALVFVVLFGSGILQISQPTEAPTQPAGTEPSETLPADLTSYSAESDAAAAAAAQNIVATSGNMVLTNDTLQTYYWMGVYQFLSENSYLLSYIGLDLTKPLDQQIYNPEDNTTWQEAFLDFALESWHRYAAVIQYAEAEGYTLSEEGKTHMASFGDATEEMAVSYGYTDAQQMLLTELGPGATKNGYVSYREIEYSAMEYMEGKYDALIPSLEEMETYYTEHLDELKAAKASKEDGDVVDVRHILIIPEGGTDDGNGNKTYSEDEYAACYAQALQILNEWKAGEADENSFAALATKKSEDGGSASNGGLYTDVTVGYMVQEFEDWIFDETRQYGDTDLVKTQFGYHIMYFVAREPAWQRTVAGLMVSEKMNKIVEEAMASYELEIRYDQVVLGTVPLA